MADSEQWPDNAGGMPSKTLRERGAGIESYSPLVRGLELCANPNNALYVRISETLMYFYNYALSPHCNLIIINVYCYFLRKTIPLDYYRLWLSNIALLYVVF